RHAHARLLHHRQRVHHLPRILTMPLEATPPKQSLRRYRHQGRRIARMNPRRWLTVLTISLIGVVAAACDGSAPATHRPTSTSRTGIHKIQHVIVVMQENRSFDSYFGTFPGADGIPMFGGVPTVCVPAPPLGPCVRSHVDHRDVNGGGPHGAANATADINSGKMDGFVTQANAAQKGCFPDTNPACSSSNSPDVMGYHGGTDIPNYWAYARAFV